MIKTSRIWGRSLVRRLHCRSSVGLAVLTFCLSHSVFGLSSEDFEPPISLRLYTFTSFSSLANYTTDFVSSSCYGSPYSVFLNHPFGIAFNDSGTVSIPSFSGVLTNSNFDVKYPIRANPLSGGRAVFLSPFLFDDLRSLFVSLVTLYNSGYRGPGVENVSSSSFHAVNFDYRLIVSEVLSSTNSTFRQILLAHLSSIQASVQNIEINVSGLQSSVDSANGYLSSISNSVLAASSNLATVSSLVDGVFSNSFSTSVAVSSLKDLFNIVNSPIVDFPSWLDTMVYCGVADQSSADSWLRSYADFQNPTSRADFVSLVQREIQDANFADTFIKRFNSSSLVGAGSSFNESVVDALIGDYPVDAGDSKRGAKAVNNRTSIKSQLQSWRNEVKQQLDDWKTDLKSDLQAWKTSDETGYLNIKNSIDNNFSYTSRGSTNQLPFTSYITNFVTRILTNSIEHSSADVQSNATSNADRQIKDSQDRWEEFKRYTLGDGEGLNVKIKFPLYEEHGYHVNVRDDAVVSAIENLHAMPVELNAIKDNIQWFREGGPININLPTNLVDVLDEILDAITNRPSNSYLLLDDYAFYISNGVYQTSIEQLENDFPNVYTNLQKYGLTSSGNGNFWTLFGANLIYQSGFIGSLLDDMATIRKFADDHIEGGFAAGIKSIVEKFPSPSQLEDDVNNATNRLYEISLATTNFVFGFESVTNIAPSVFKPFADSFDSPPSGDIVFFKTANEKYVSIPVHDQASVWSLIRRGIAFALVGVQFLLFPKFVLMIVVLFDRLSSRFIKFVPTDR